VAFDLSHKSWKLAFTNGKRFRHCSVEGKNLSALNEEISKAKKKFGLADDCHLNPASSFLGMVNVVRIRRIGHCSHVPRGNAS